LVFGIGVGDVGLAFLQFGLAELDNGAKTKIVAGLRKLQGQSGLLPELPGDGKALIGAAGILPGSAHITGDTISKVGQFLPIDLGLKVGGFGARIEQGTIEDGDVDVHPNGAVPIGDVVVPNGSLPDNPQSA